MGTSGAPFDSLPTGRLQPIGGRRFFVELGGSGGLPVVFLAGAGGFALDYWGVHRAAGGLGTSVLYDRSGTGWSDPIALPRTLREVTDELRVVLRAVGLEPPFVLVGHSLGGGYARHFAQRFPDETAGLLLLDPLHEDGDRLFPARVTEMGKAMRTQPVPDLPAEMLEAYRPIFERNLATWPAEIRIPVIERHLKLWRNGFVEASNIDLLYDELRHGGPLPDVPVIVLTAMAVDPAQRQFLSEDDLQGVNAAKLTMNRSVASSVRRGENRELPTASHAWMHLEDEAAVTQALEDLLARV
jgi:pimeloyl-ACP methyl ester carboxylesterase